MKLQTSCFEIARRFIGVEEIRGSQDHPLIDYWLSLCQLGRDFAKLHDETPWCSAFAQFPPLLLGLPRSKDARARSWLLVGVEIPLSAAEPENDVVIYKRGSGPQPGPEVIDAPGHANFFGAIDGIHVVGIGGNQGDSVSVGRYRVEDVIGVRRLA